MSGNTFGNMFKLTTFGESHGVGLGGVIDGCPSGIEMSEAIIQKELDKRKPGQGGITATNRKEPDAVEIFSGVFEGKTTGTSIGFIIRNTDQRSRDYSNIKDVYRPAHGDITYDAKYGFRDYRGGGRSSGRETACRVAGGAIALAFLETLGINVNAYTVELGGIPAETIEPQGAQERPFFSADPDIIEQWEENVKAIKAQGDTLGGVVEISATGVPAGLGEPVFDKLDARIAYALMGVGAVKAIEIGAGTQASCSLGSLNNDTILTDGFASNNAGGILAGISNGDTITARAHIKPIPSISQPQATVNNSGEATEIRIGGRHDISAIPRVVPVLKAMVALTLADMVLMQRRMG